MSQPKYRQILREKKTVSVYKCLRLSAYGNFNSPAVPHQWNIGVNTYKKGTTGFWVFWTRTEALISGYMYCGRGPHKMQVVRLIAHAEDLIEANSSDYCAVFKKLILPKQRTKK